MTPPTHAAAAPMEQPPQTDAFLAPVLAAYEAHRRECSTWPTDSMHAVAVLGSAIGKLNKVIMQAVYEPAKNPPGALRAAAESAAAVAIRFVEHIPRYECLPGIHLTALANTRRALGAGFDGALAGALTEYHSAERRFPTWPLDPIHAFAVLGEEFGELDEAVVSLICYNTDLGNLRMEAEQTAAMALRFLANLDTYAFEPCQQARRSGAVS